VPGVVNVKEKNILPGGDGRVVFESGPKRPKLESVSRFQYGVARSRTLYKLIEEGSLQGEGIRLLVPYGKGVAVGGTVCMVGGTVV